MAVDLASLKKALPRAPEIWLATGLKEAPKHGIDTIDELATFFAECAHESADFTHLEENLNYSAKRLAEVAPARFAANPQEPNPALWVPNARALALEHAPEALANYWYADENRGPKSKLGNVHPGDGWLFHGRGPIQITGRALYERLRNDSGLDVLNHPEVLLVPYAGITSACWYWRVAKLDEVDDDEDLTLDTRRINGGEIGLARRQQLFNIIHACLSEAA